MKKCNNHKLNFINNAKHNFKHNKKIFSAQKHEYSNRFKFDKIKSHSP